MIDYGQFHDAYFEGVLIEEDKTACILLRTEQKVKFTVVLTEVAALTVNEMKAGNIVFEAQLRDAPELRVEDIGQLYDLVEGEKGEMQAQRLLQQIREKALMLFEMYPSFGATCLVLAHSIEILPRAEWMKRYCKNSASTMS